MANSDNKINIGDVWKDIDSLQINIGDAWKDADVMIKAIAEKLNTPELIAEYESKMTELAAEK